MEMEEDVRLIMRLIDERGPEFVRAVLDKAEREIVQARQSIEPQILDGAFAETRSRPTPAHNRRADNLIDKRPPDCASG